MTLPAQSLGGGQRPWISHAARIRRSDTTFLSLSLMIITTRQPRLFHSSASHVFTLTRTALTRPRTLYSSSKQGNSAGSLAFDSTAILTPSRSSLPLDTQQKPTMPKPLTPLAVLPLANIVRSWVTTTVASSPILLASSLAIMSTLANSHNPLLDPDRNPLLRGVLKKTFYAQFCAGETPEEVNKTVTSLKRIGFDGVILGYAKEVVIPDSDMADLEASVTGAAAESAFRKEVGPWTRGTLDTVLLATPGDYVALKFTGAGRQALYALSKRLPPPPALARSIDEICQVAQQRGVWLLIDAEQTALQPGIDDWTLAYMRKYNTLEKATIYGTYQAYLKSTPATLSGHLAVANKEGFTLGVKLVRGAYLGSDPRHLIHDTKTDTDACYDGIAAALLKRKWDAPLTSQPLSLFPNVNLVLASHNRESMRKARALLEAGHTETEVAFAQLQGMADEVSCELVARDNDDEKSFAPRAYKYLLWGSTGGCMKYLLRRAYENRDAVERTRCNREAMSDELRRRMRAFFGLAAR